MGCMLGATHLKESTRVGPLPQDPEVVEVLKTKILDLDATCSIYPWNRPRLTRFARLFRLMKPGAQEPLAHFWVCPGATGSSRLRSHTRTNTNTSTETQTSTNTDASTSTPTTNHMHKHTHTHKHGARARAGTRARPGTSPRKRARAHAHAHAHAQGHGHGPTQWPPTHPILSTGYSIKFFPDGRRPHVSSTISLT